MKHIKENFGWYLLGIILIGAFIYKLIYKAPGNQTIPIVNGSPCVTNKNGVDVNGTYKDGICIPE